MNYTGLPGFVKAPGARNLEIITPGPLPLQTFGVCNTQGALGSGPGVIGACGGLHLAPASRSQPVVIGVPVVLRHHAAGVREVLVVAALGLLIAGALGHPHLGAVLGLGGLRIVHVALIVVLLTAGQVEVIVVAFRGAHA